jgi:predicted nuclease of predicted toxin-antitoxin system
MFRMDDYSNNNIIKELINNTPNIIIHEHDFVTISLQGQQKPKSVICLTCGSFYSEKSGKLIASATRSNKTATSANSLCN